MKFLIGLTLFAGAICVLMAMATDYVMDYPIWLMLFLGLVAILGFYLMTTVEGVGL